MFDFKYKNPNAAHSVESGVRRKFPQKIDIRLQRDGRIWLFSFRSFIVRKRPILFVFSSISFDNKNDAHFYKVDFGHKNTIFKNI